MMMMMMIVFSFQLIIEHDNGVNGGGSGCVCAIRKSHGFKLLS